MKLGILGMALAFSLGAGAADLPRLQDGRFQITLFAEQPLIWTPTGIAVDDQNRVFVIESNTHLPKPDYPGPKTDRIKVFTDRDGDGHADEVSIFAEGFKAAMNLAFGPKGELYVVQRDALFLVRDPKAPTTLLHLDTKGDFPHNGLGGLCVGPDGWLYVGCGENLGLDYALTGADGTALRGGGEGGNIFRCQPDGSKLERFATGFWNPFSLAFDDSGNLFAVDNDPDGRPPCRLVHVIAGGNYGYQFRYGRSGLHPFVAWDGELPGTLPMVAGTGEAPSGLIWCAPLGWPLEYRKSLFSTSWGDNLLETFPLEPRGISFQSERKVFARGGASFRPVAMAAGPNGAIYITDWMDREYAVHQKGRIWRLTFRGTFPLPALEKVAMHREVLPAASVTSNDPFLRSMAVTALAKLPESELLSKSTAGDARERLGVLLALREKGATNAFRILPAALQDASEDIRRMAMIWGAEQKQSSLKSEMLAAAMREPRSMVLLQTYLGAAQILNASEARSPWTQGSSGAQLVEAALEDNSQPAELRAVLRKLKDIPQAHPIVGSPVAEPAKRPQTESEWLRAIGFGGRPDEGAKLFASEKLGCAKCHRIAGEGGMIGPDLTRIALASDRAKLVNSILDPSANIGPLYGTHEVRTKSGEEYSGLALDNKSSDKLTVIMATGERVEIPREKIASDTVSNISLMPAGLETGLKVGEFADLISFLQTLR